MNLEIVLIFHVLFSAMRHVRFLLDSDLETESTKQGANELMWAVFTAFIK